MRNRRPLLSTQRAMEPFDLIGDVVVLAVRDPLAVCLWFYALSAAARRTPVELGEFDCQIRTMIRWRRPRARV